jgi:2-methylisocitrate lyase-like PEP mutase family enzyme
MGVARVSIPVASVLVAHRALKRFFEALHASPTGLLEGRSDWLSSFAEYNEFVGLKEYRRQENEFLPRSTLEEKYDAHS